MGITLILDNIRSAFNVGSIFRTADCLGTVEKICLCGITPDPDSDRVKKTALGAEDYIPWGVYNKTKDIIIELQSKGVKVYAVENIGDTKNFKEVDYPEKVGLILGHERWGISKEILELVDGVIEIPMKGKKSSLNVGVAAAIVVYEVSKKKFED